MRAGPSGIASRQKSTSTGTYTSCSDSRKLTNPRQIRIAGAMTGNSIPPVRTHLFHRRPGYYVHSVIVIVVSAIIYDAAGNTAITVVRSYSTPHTTWLQLRLGPYSCKSVSRPDVCKYLVVHINKIVRLNPVPKGVSVVLAHFLGIYYYRPVDAHLNIKVVLCVAELVL
jgi:hypothetical protein